MLNWYTTVARTNSTVLQVGKRRFEKEDNMKNEKIPRIKAKYIQYSTNDQKKKKKKKKKPSNDSDSCLIITIS